MKLYTYFLLILLGTLNIGCSKDDDNSSGLDNGEYTSHWYYSYEATQLLTAATFGMETVEDFIPYTVAHIGDTLFIANTGQAGHSLLVFSQKKGELLGTLKAWQFNNEEKSFTSPIDAIIAAGNRLYVAERQSCIHVFQLPDLSYLTCIGNGKWSGPVFQAQALTVKDGLIFARDKN